MWKNLYLREFDRPRLRGSRGFPSLSMVRADGRPVKALPTKGHVDHLKDWKWMFRISCNWRTGMCLVETLIVPLIRDVQAGRKLGKYRGQG